MFADNLLDMDHAPSTLSSQHSSKFSNIAASITTTSHGANKLLTSQSNNNHKPTAMELFLDAVGDDTILKNNSSQRSTIVEELYNYRLLVIKLNSKHGSSTSSSSNFWKIFNDDGCSIILISQVTSSVDLDVENTVTEVEFDCIVSDGTIIGIKFGDAIC
ncbi:unnamed protein product [Rotaria socialis]|uniref:Uncharacterized protein n=1 Tax=Rotaria socialis TaxID=392032 RepID=A0A821M9S2_9BILA|nr:unnamed protein product [Rotaria socialis]CAF4434409.1 unnamed protein product [Rotaria socialis]CAF4494703.1 unnamed protein product [Rotaria socialis]CAF4600215.1 unnamed protein product [Rotaria socialis]CAF4764394.1 unnamed protein product [Rotaria socialis]